ncbi:MAG TPA: phosphatidate cytidylyltransferase [Actinobacteria bacterium]|nr:phosphatidate cytidylyltransferase [Actinomycetota bacterium]
MLKQRIISAIVGGLLLIGLLFLGKYPFFLVILAIVLFSLDEFYSLLRFRGMQPNAVLGMLGGLFLCLGALLGKEGGMMFALALSVFTILIWQIFTLGRTSISNSTLTIFGSFYIGFLLAHTILIRGLGEHGPFLMLLVFIGTWVCDTAAYGAGVKIGKRKLAPQVSPNKTWEGTIGGALASSISLGLICLAFFPWLSFLRGSILGLAIGIASPLGDLAESRLKREMRVKNTGSLIPGHGGVLDRFDSLIFTAPVAYYLLKLLL